MLRDKWTLSCVLLARVFRSEGSRKGHPASSLEQEPDAQLLSAAGGLLKWQPPVLLVQRLQLHPPAQSSR